MKEKIGPDYKYFYCPCCTDEKGYLVQLQRSNGMWRCSKCGMLYSEEGMMRQMEIYCVRRQKK